MMIRKKISMGVIVFTHIMIAGFLCLTPPVQSREIRFVNINWPPFIIVSNQGQLSGIDVDILREAAHRLGVDLKTDTCNWRNCLKMMAAGRADIISAILKRPDREQYLHYIEPPYIEKITEVFYLPQGKGHLITHYEDVYALRVGVLEGSAHFIQFDNDLAINKVAVPKTEQLLQMLDAGRIDAFIGMETVIDYMIMTHNLVGRFDKSVYRYEKETPLYMAISKHSVFAEKLDEIRLVIRTLIDDGTVQAILKKYLSDQ